MRKIVLVLALVFVSFQAFAQQRGYNEALGLAQLFLNAPGARQSAGGSTGLHLFRTGKDNAYYLFTTDESRGFVIVSGDERMPEILGYSYSSPVSTDELPDNVRYWLSLYEEEYQCVRNGVAEPAANNSAYSSLTEDIAPIVTTQWGQSSPYYNDCPKWGNRHCLVGCVATAMTQVMAHYRYPDCGRDSVTYSTDQHGIELSEDLSLHPFDWDNILDTYSYGSTARQDSAVANLCYMGGIAVKMDYDPDGSGATEKNQIKALYYNFGYDADMCLCYASRRTADEWHKLIQDELSQGRPLLYCGYDTGSAGGHAFILDGYQAPADSASIPYYHFNWGWYGEDDGFYSISKINPPGYHFTNGQVVVAHVQPEDSIQEITSMFEGRCKLSVETIPVDQLSEIQATVSYSNCSIRNFTGKVTFRLFKPDGTVTDIQTCEYDDIALKKGKTNQVITFTPDSILGTYTLEAYSQASGSETEDRIFFSGSRSFEVTESTGISAPTVAVSKDPEVIYSVEGKRQTGNSPQKGINIVRDSSGKTKKVAL